MKTERIEGALLMGVCAGAARAFKWNVWVLRGLFAAFLLIKTVWAVAIYAGLALLMHFSIGIFDSEEDDGLSSPELSGRNQRINDLEKRFRDLENEGS